mgnify:FL=1
MPLTTTTWQARFRFAPGGAGGVCSSGAEARMTAIRHGLWRSLVARLTGGQEVVGSNPASPTTFPRVRVRI